MSHILEASSFLKDIRNLKDLKMVDQNSEAKLNLLPHESQVKRATQNTAFSSFLSGLTSFFPHFGQLTLWIEIT